VTDGQTQGYSIHCTITHVDWRGKDGYGRLKVSQLSEIWFRKHMTA